MSLRRKLTLYLILIHAVFGATIVALLGGHRAWLIAVEAVAAAFLGLGLWLAHAVFAPLALVRSGADLLRDRDFATRLREVGHPELDPLIGVYNRMADHLREERIRGEEREHFLQKIVAATPLGVIVLDLDGRIALVNVAAAALLGETTAALAGRSPSELTAPLGRELETLAPGETKLVRVQGRRRLLCRAQTFMDRGFARRFLTLEELTDELHRSEKAAYGKLVRMMSHEVNNTAGAVQSLLQSCLNYAGQLADGDRDDYRRALDVAMTRTGSLNRFMQDFAEVVRLPAPRLAPCDLRVLLERIETLLHADCVARRIRWQWHLRDDVPPQPLDSAQMEQALINICRNALEAIREDGTVTIGLGVAGGRVTITVQDTGGGVPPEVEANLFTPFFTSKPGGQGLGLTLVQEILLAHGCGFALENADGGARFSITMADAGPPRGCPIGRR